MDKLKKPPDIGQEGQLKRTLGGVHLGEVLDSMLFPFSCLDLISKSILIMRLAVRLNLSAGQREISLVASMDIRSQTLAIEL
ncbi:hypothetical protein M5D96_001170 [Drosophila gunungcola]|uniref:Uncharacterized protein n=1 Tax=Drosophila gunungcola TaxID=103775 RepID=A0A9P9YYA9_9MUSC|nr:hypothetical protein M5D96_001170 [Drosophila gunungcola]